MGCKATVGDGADRADVMTVQAALKAQNPEQIVAVRLPATPAAAQRVLELARQGPKWSTWCSTRTGERRDCGGAAAHMRDVLREVHTSLVKAGMRDEITLIASGGIAQAEHLAKAIICGADLVAIDIPLLVALECRLCGECQKENPCPVTLEEIGRDLAVHRIVNLMGAWHSQLLEVLGAMGIREVRRLRGETGRCMFFEDLEREAFGKLFGKERQRERVAAPIRTIDPVHDRHPAPTAERGRVPRARGFRRGFAPARSWPRRGIGTRSASTAFAARRTACRAADASRSASTGSTSGPRAIARSSAPSTTAASGRTAPRADPYCIEALSAESPLALRQSGLRNDGRLPLDARFAGEQLGNGGDGLAAGQAPGERDGGLGRRLRPPAVPLPGGAARRPCGARTFRPRSC